MALTVSRSWFAAEESLLRRVLSSRDDYPASEAELVTLLDAAGLQFPRWRDPWGSPLRAEVANEWRYRRVRIFSSGPDRLTGTGDDRLVAELTGRYFVAAERRIREILDAQSELPASEDAFVERLSAAGFPWDELIDPWGRPYLVSVRESTSFTDRMEFYTLTEFNRNPEERRRIIPHKQTVRVVTIQSRGPETDGTVFSVAQFSRVLSAPATMPPVADGLNLGFVRSGSALGGAGVIAGKVVDPTGAGIPNALVVLDTQEVAFTDALGEFRFEGLRTGKHALEAVATGFQRNLVQSVPAVDGRVTDLVLVLNIGSITEEVVVSASPASLEAQAAEVVTLSASRESLSTPRVRTYFPETLFWEPELRTDANGRATVRVPLADTITNWRVSVAASTLDGRIAESTTELKVFQPFAVELEVPASLTVGDEISVPIPVRNYLDRGNQCRFPSACLPRSLCWRPCGSLAPWKPLERAMHGYPSAPHKRRIKRRFAPLPAAGVSRTPLRGRFPYGLTANAGPQWSTW